MTMLDDAPMASARMMAFVVFMLFVCLRKISASLFGRSLNAVKRTVRSVRSDTGDEKTNGCVFH
jgi:hypothetical protein